MGLNIAVYIQWHTFGDRAPCGAYGYFALEESANAFFGYAVNVCVECQFAV